MTSKLHCACGQRLVPGHHHLYGLIGLWCLKRGDCTARVGGVATAMKKLKSDLVVDKALRLGLIRPDQEFRARCAANWDLSAFCESIGQDFKKFIEGLW